MASGQGARPPVKAEQSTDAMELLSLREVDVLPLLSAPLTQRDISQALSISRDTVKSHPRAIYRKLGSIPARMQSQPAANSA